MIKSLSSYHLIFELLYDGKGNIHPDIEPIDTKEIIKILECRANRVFGTDVKKIVDWFLNTEGVASSEEIEGISIVLDIKDIERKSLAKIKQKGTKDRGSDLDN